MLNYNVKENCHIKSVVNPRKVLGVCSPHHFIYKNHQFAVTEHYKKIFGLFTDYHSSDKIRINHYYCKSAEEYIKKTERGNADNENKRTINEAYLNFTETTHDYVIQKFLPELEKRMNL